MILDFREVEAITPSFIDEMLGRLLLSTGVEEFRRRVRLERPNETVHRLVNYVLSHRAHQQPHAEQPTGK